MRLRLVCVMFATLLLSFAVLSALADPQATVKPSALLIECLHEGNRCFKNDDYKNAINFYSKALEIEKKQPTLPKNYWRILVNNLGMSYGISGDFQKAKETFEYGLSKDPTYPMFLYNQACTFAELSDLDNAITNLKLAFKYKENVLPGEKVPDPRQDSSFKRFLNDRRFRDTLAEVGIK